LVSLTLGLFTVSLFAQGLIPLFTRAFYARQNVIIPVVISAITIVINVVTTYYLTHIFGIPGMAMAFSITSIIELIMLSAELHHRIGNIHDEYLIINVLKIVIASAFAGLAAFLSLYAIAPLVNTSTYWGILIQAAGAGIIGSAIYIGASWVMGLSESHNLVKLLRSVLVKSAKPFSMIWNILNF
jgi:putative peptidoglycan lipid II flippase